MKPKNFYKVVKIAPYIFKRGGSYYVLVFDKMVNGKRTYLYQTLPAQSPEHAVELGSPLVKAFRQEKLQGRIDDYKKKYGL